MGPKESKRDDTRSFLGGHGPTRILPVFLEKLSTRPKAVTARTRRALHISRAVRIIHSPRNNQSDLASVMDIGQGMLRSRVGESRNGGKIRG